MARWRLKDAHYLSVPGIEWEYKETDRNTNRQARVVYEVPLYLNPKDRSDWNYPEDESIIVTNKMDRAYPRDLMFRGPPTPDMEPLDDEAQAISDSERHKWINPIEALNMTYSESRLSEFEREIAQLMANTANRPKEAPNLSLGGISPEAFNRLQEQVAELMEQNAKLQNQVLNKSGRRM